MKYTWGDSVYLKKMDEKGQVVSKIPAAVIWVTQIETNDDANYFNRPVGSTLYNVEFGDGSMQEFVPEDMLEAYSDEKS